MKISSVLSVSKMCIPDTGSLMWFAFDLRTISSKRTRELSGDKDVAEVFNKGVVNMI